MPRKNPTATPPKTEHPRKLKVPKYQSFKLQKRLKPEVGKIPSGFSLIKGAVMLVRANWKVFGGIAVLYGLLNLILVPTLSGSDLASAKNALSQTVSGHPQSPLASSISLFAYILGAAGGSNTQVAGVYRFLLVFITSLAIIWTLRQVYSDKAVQMRDGFYYGMYPLVPALLVLIVAVVQLIPMAAGSYIFSLVYANQSATSVELMAWGLGTFSLVVLSFYLVCSSVIALYVVCLPDMKPMAAMRSARQLVKFRRWTIIRRLMFLPFILLLTALIIMLPVLLFITSIAGWVFVLLVTIMLPIIHAYLYKLYRELL